jgi:hypothetical protein
MLNAVLVLANSEGISILLLKRNTASYGRIVRHLDREERSAAGTGPNKAGLLLSGGDQELVAGKPAMWHATAAPQCPTHARVRCVQEAASDSVSAIRAAAARPPPPPVDVAVRRAG